jgi:lipoprotein-releasing system permease protein
MRARFFMRARFVLFVGARMLRGKAGTARYLRGAVLGIAVSLVPLIVVMEVSTGMIEGITARLLEVGTFHLQAAVPADLPRAELDRLALAVARLPGVVAAVPERQGTAMIVSPRGATGVAVRFVPSNVLELDRGLARSLTLDPPTAGLARADSVLLSSAMASTLGVRPGDSVSVLTTYGQGMSGLPRLATCVVAGTFSSGYQELDATLAYAPLELADRILSARAARAMIGVKVADPFAELGPLERQVAAAAGGARVATWREIEYARLSSFSTTKALLLFIMALVVIVASVSVSSSVLMILFERRADLGILKSIGAGPRSLSLSFLMTGLATGLLGSVLGIACGLALAVNINEVISGLEWLVNAGMRLFALLRSPFAPGAAPMAPFTLFNSAYYLSSIPIRINAAEVCAAAALTVLLAAIASYVPAARAARTRPLEVLRKV